MDFVSSLHIRNCYFLSFKDLTFGKPLKLAKVLISFCCT